jgi:hypothetical protein
MKNPLYTYSMSNVNNDPIDYPTDPNTDWYYWIPKYFTTVRHPIFNNPSSGSDTNAANSELNGQPYRSMVVSAYPS